MVAGMQLRDQGLKPPDLRAVWGRGAGRLRARGQMDFLLSWLILGGLPHPVPQCPHCGMGTQTSYLTEGYYEDW